MVKVINSEEFNNKVLSDNSSAVLVDFFAVWCGPCKMFSPVIEEISKEMSGKINVFKVDVDKSTDIAQRYGIMGVPTAVIFKNGKAVDKIVGFQPKDVLENRIEKYLNI